MIIKLCLDVPDDFSRTDSEGWPIPIPMLNRADKSYRSHKPQLPQIDFIMGAGWLDGEGVDDAVDDEDLLLYIMWHWLLNLLEICMMPLKMTTVVRFRRSSRGAHTRQLFTDCTVKSSNPFRALIHSDRM
jgi:hypothetical protein